MITTKSEISIRKGRHFYITRSAIEVLSNFPFKLLFLLAFSPAFFSACSKEKPFPDEDGETSLEIILKSPAATSSGLEVDLYVFNDDAMGMLDSHSRLHPVGNTVSAASRKGSKRIVAVANSGEEALDWGSIYTFYNICTAICRLEKDNPHRPVLSGTAVYEAGSNKKFGIELEPVCSRIRLQSISCNFEGRPYQGKVLSDVKVYLINVCTAASLLPIIGGGCGQEYVNLGGWSDGDTSGGSLWKMLRFDIDGAVGEAKVMPGKTLYCYPNPILGGVSQPVSKLVIEGRIDGHTYYYPIVIGESSGGILRGADYAIDVSITRLGADDPDSSLSPGTLTTGISVTPWVEKEEETIIFN